MGAAAMPMAIGAMGGAIMNKDDPLKGAALGGALGYGGHALMGATGLGATGAQAAQSAPGMAGMTGGTANNAIYGALPTLNATAPGSQAAMLAAQTADFGPSGFLATGDALNAPGMAGKAFGMGNKLAFGGQDASKMMQAGQQLQNQDRQQLQQRQQQRQQMPMMAQPQIPQNNQYQSPYQARRYNSQPSILPQFRG